MRYLFSSLAAVGLFLGVAVQAKAGLIGVAGGNGNPGPMLGGYTMTPFPADPQANLIYETSVPTPLGGSVSFSPAVFHLNSTALWGNPWGNSYTGDVYANYGPSLSPVTLTLPSGTNAFYLFIEPTTYDLAESIAVMAQDGTTVTQVVKTDGGGAKYYGFYGTGGDHVMSLTITGPANANQQFGFGEMAIARSAEEAVVPEPGTLSLLVIGAMAAPLWFRRRKAARPSL